MRETDRTAPWVRASLVSLVLTVLLASITHADEFGFRAFAAGFAMAAILSLLNIWFQRTGNGVALWVYGLLSAFIIAGFGIFNGFWNHAFKVFLTYLHGGHLPPLLASLFMDPRVGGPLYEGIGVATFVSSMFAAYFIFKTIQTARKTQLHYLREGQWS